MSALDATVTGDRPTRLRAKLSATSGAHAHS